VSKADVEDQCEGDLTLTSLWFSAVNGNDVNAVECMIQQDTARVNARQVYVHSHCTWLI